MRRGLAASRTEGQEAIEAGLVTVDGAPALKAARQVDPAQAIAIDAPPRAFVSRGGQKLAHALRALDVEVAGRSCLDAGASTGGFTDCLLQHGAARVVAVDVGYGQIHERLRRDERVVVRERTNIRRLRREDLPADLSPHGVDLVVADLSFISLAAVLPTLRGLAADDAALVGLVKPQFEAGRDQVGKGGVVREPEVWGRCLARVVEAGAELGWALRGATASPLLGPAGNVEFLVHLGPPGRHGASDQEGAPDEPAAMIAAAVEEGRRRREDGAGPRAPTDESGSDDGSAAT